MTKMLMVNARLAFAALLTVVVLLLLGAIIYAMIPVSDEQTRALRYMYATLAMICSTGFVATLLIRWEVLRRGERIIRIFLVAEHLGITYGGYVALKSNLPASLVALILVISMTGIVFGFAIWVYEDLIRGEIDNPSVRTSER